MSLARWHNFDGPCCALRETESGPIKVNLFAASDAQLMNDKSTESYSGCRTGACGWCGQIHFSVHADLWKCLSTGAKRRHTEVSSLDLALEVNGERLRITSSNCTYSWEFQESGWSWPDESLISSEDYLGDGR